MSSNAYNHWCSLPPFMERHHGSFCTTVYFARGLGVVSHHFFGVCNCGLSVFLGEKANRKIKQILKAFSKRRHTEICRRLFCANRTLSIPDGADNKRPSENDFSDGLFVLKLSLFFRSKAQQMLAGGEPCAEHAQGNHAA